LGAAVSGEIAGQPRCLPATMNPNVLSFSCPAPGRGDGVADKGIAPSGGG
jgi:hypothetical protein